jgi:hypothetical protein
MADGFLLGPELLARTRRVIDVVEGQVTPSGFRTSGGLFEEGPAEGRVFRICTFTGAWSINSTKTVTFKYQTATPNTVVATNLVCGLSPTSSCDVSIAKEGTAWYLVQPNLTHLPGYSASGTQVLAVISGNLRFIGTTAC